MTKEDEVGDNRQHTDKGSGSDGLAYKHGSLVGWIIFQNSKSRMLKQPSHVTWKTHKTGFHLEMTETVKLRLQKEKKLLCVKALPKV